MRTKKGKGILLGTGVAVLGAVAMLEGNGIAKQMVPTRVYAATTNTYEGFEYEVNTNENNKEVTITKYTGSDASVTVPDTIDGLPVTRVGERAFNANGQIVSVQIGKNVKSIGRYAFSSSGNLKTVQLSNAVTTVSYTHLTLPTN